MEAVGAWFGRLPCGFGLVDACGDRIWVSLALLCPARQASGPRSGGALRRSARRLSNETLLAC